MSIIGEVNGMFDLGDDVSDEIQYKLQLLLRIELNAVCHPFLGYIPRQSLWYNLQNLVWNNVNDAINNLGDR